MKLKSVVFVLLALLVGVGETRGQERNQSGPVAFGPSLGLHGMGLIWEFSPVSRAALDLQAEGLRFRGKVAAGIGIRIDLHQERTGRVYGRVLYGWAKCVDPVGGSEGCVLGKAARRAVSPGAGVELRLSETGVAWAGVEAGYWRALDRDTLGRDLDHFSGAVILRFRPW